MADWGYVIAGFGASALAIAGYVLRTQRRIDRLRRSRRPGERP